LPLGDLAARAGSCTDASFRAVFRYPPLGLYHAAQPDERFFPRMLARRRSWGFTPFAGLIPMTGGRAASLRQLNLMD